MIMTTQFEIMVFHWSEQIRQLHAALGTDPEEAALALEAAGGLFWLEQFASLLDQCEELLTERRCKPTSVTARIRRMVRHVDDWSTRHNKALQVRYSNIAQGSTSRLSSFVPVSGDAHDR
jgi:hypothetical protein